MSSSTLLLTKTVFEDGKYTHRKPTKKPTVSPPKPLLIVTPTEVGEYCVLILLHGYLLNNYFYSQLIDHVASHGFIVIAPQLYTLAGTDAIDDVKSTALVTDWVVEHLSEVLPTGIKPNLNKIALSGHSRGGKAAFALPLGKVKDAKTSVKFSALIGIDPVDGISKGNQTEPHVLTYEPNSFDLKMPVLVIGSGLGECSKIYPFPPCAPKGVNHEEFYKECCKPACYFVVKDFGHVDMLDDGTWGIKGLASYCMCKNGKSREPMRRFVGGIIVAFLRAYLEGDTSDLMAIRYGKEKAPVEFDKVDFRE